MALFDILMPQLINCGRGGGQQPTNLMDQDWNHWKLQIQSWIDDAKDATTVNNATDGGCQPGANGATPPTCGASANQRTRCCGNVNVSEYPNSPLDGLNQMWAQLSNAGQQSQKRYRKEKSNNHIQNDQRKYVIKLDVQHFEPNEISVKIVDNQIVVDGRHPERTDRLGLVSRKFQRKYELPSDVEPNTIVSTLTPSGVLIIEGLKKRVPTQTGAEIEIPVIREQTNGSADDQNEQQID